MAGGWLGDWVGGWPAPRQAGGRHCQLDQLDQRHQRLATRALLCLHFRQRRVSVADTPRRGLLPMMTSQSCHSWYTSAAVRLFMCKRRSSGKLVMKTLRASYASGNGWPADLRTIVEPDDHDAICRARRKSEGAPMSWVATAAGREGCYGHGGATGGQNEHARLSNPAPCMSSLCICRQRLVDVLPS